MKKSPSRTKTTGPSATKDQPEPEKPSSPKDSTIHNGSANAFDATEEARDDEDSDEDNDDFAREND
jgi:hypothetical protein